MVLTDVIVYDKQGQRKVDVKIVDGTVVEMGEELSDEEIISGNGAYLLPGLIDLNVRVNDGALSGRSLEQLSHDALRGGVTHVVLSPDCVPSVDNEIVLEFVNKNSEIASGAVLSTALNSVKEEGQLSNIAVLLKKGATAPYITTKVNSALICRIAEYAKMYNKTILCKAEDGSLMADGLMIEGRVSTQLGLGGVSTLSEEMHVASMIEVAKHYEVRVLFKSIASPESITMIYKAKKEGAKVFCEVSLHHLLYSDETCEGFNTTAKLDPPLRQKHELPKLLEALKCGKIDILTSLHQPNSPVNKEVAFFDAAFGCESIDHILSLYYTKLVKNGIISMEALIEYCIVNPAKLIGRRGGSIEVGERAELIMFDPNDTVKVSNKNSLYNGEELNGMVTMCIKGEEVTPF